MKYAIRHRTHYAYQAPVRDSFNELHLQPPSGEAQTVDAFLLKITPPVRLQHYRDFYLNPVHHFEIPHPHDTLTIDSEIQVTTHPPAPLPADARLATADDLKLAMRTEQLYDFILASHYTDTDVPTWKLAIDATVGATDIWQTALRLMQFVHQHLTYQSQSTEVHTPARQVLEHRRGVCQDYAHVFISLCRSLRMPARYVSGYLATEIASATHAWTEVYIPGHGWRGLDPTHNCQPDHTYIKLAIGRDYADVPPVRGTYRGNVAHQMEVCVKVEPRQ
jgi:transglutaminase-like putative cysteine protease